MRYPRPPSPAEGGEASPAERITRGYENDKVPISGPHARKTDLEGLEGGAAVPGVDTNQRDTQTASLVGSRIWTGLVYLQRVVNSYSPGAHAPITKQGNLSSSSSSSGGGSSSGRTLCGVTDTETNMPQEDSTVKQGTLRTKSVARGSYSTSLVPLHIGKEEKLKREERLETDGPGADGEDILKDVPRKVWVELTAPDIGDEAGLTLKECSPNGNDAAMSAGLKEAAESAVGTEGPTSQADEVSKSNGTPTSEIEVPNEPSTVATQPPAVSPSSSQESFNGSDRNSSSTSRACPPHGGVHRQGQESSQQTPLKIANPGEARTGATELEAGAREGRRLAAIVWAECKVLDSEQAALVR